MIRLKSIEINNFRGIQKGLVGDFADVNILVGRNNSGKSTVIEAIHRLAVSVTGVALDPLARKSSVWRETRLENGDYPRELWYKLDQHAPISLVGQIGEEKVEGFETVSLTLNVIGDHVSPDWNWNGRAGIIKKEKIEQFLGQATVFRVLDLGNVLIERMLWPRIIGPRQDKALVAAINSIFNQDAESYTLLDNKFWVLFPDRGVPLDSQGEGNRAALRCLMLLAVLKQSMFLVEEVECHQHPGSLERFAKAVCKMAKDNEVQLFLSTHSAECVRSFLDAAGEAGSKAVVFHLKLDNGVLDATALAPQAAQTLLDTGVDLRFLDLYA